MKVKSWYANNQTLLIRTKVVNEGEIKILDLFVEGAFISKIAPQIDDVADVEINAMGKLLLPRLIDDQVHFREPGLTHKGTIETESRAAVAGGITTFFEMPNTNPQTTNWSEFQNKTEIAKTSSWANFDSCLEAQMTTSTKYSPSTLNLCQE